MPWSLQEKTSACCSEVIVCRRFSSAILAGLQKKHLQAHSESQAQRGWQSRSSRLPSGYWENKILACRSQAQQDTGPRELRGEVKRLKSGHPASSSEKEGERPKAVSQKEDVHMEQKEEKVSRNPVGCTEEVLRTRDTGSGRVQGYGRKRWEDAGRDLAKGVGKHREEKRGKGTIAAKRITIFILLQYLYANRKLTVMNIFQNNFCK